MDSMKSNVSSGKLGVLIVCTYSCMILKKFHFHTETGIQLVEEASFSHLKRYDYHHNLDKIIDKIFIKKANWHDAWNYCCTFGMKLLTVDTVSKHGCLSKLSKSIFFLYIFAIKKLNL